jgi:hypothetical protein
MVNYVRAAATAKRLIEENGRTVVLYRKVRTPLDNSKPWRGPNPSADSAIVGTVKAIFYPIEEEDEKGGILRRGEEKMMIAHDSLAVPEDLEDIDHITDNGKLYKVVKACPIGPGDVRIAYEFIVKR